MELIVLVGPPGSGKSTLAATFTDYVYINQDTQGKDHLKKFLNSVSEGQKIVVDRMGFNVDQRKRYLEPAKAAGYKTTIKVLHQPRAVCLSRCLERKDHPTIKNQVDANNALNTFFSKYERPSENEADVIEFIYPNEYKPSAVIIDLDGTMCDVSHRLHHVRGEKRNWKAFFQELTNDSPNEWCRSIVNSMKEHYSIIFASGRPDDYYKQTKEWLIRHGLPTDLYMRCRGDHRQDYIAKEIILDFEILTRVNPLMFIDDRKQVVDLWRKRGFICLQCDDGEF